MFLHQVLGGRFGEAAPRLPQMLHQQQRPNASVRRGELRLINMSASCALRQFVLSAANGSSPPVAAVRLHRSELPLPARSGHPRIGAASSPKLSPRRWRGAWRFRP